MAYNTRGLIVVGGVVAWVKSFTNTPSLPSEYVECNGQTLSDAQSVFNGQVIPNLNGSGGVDVLKRFLRGSSTSGSTGGANCHTHARGTSDANGLIPNENEPLVLLLGLNRFSADDHRPSSYEVVWCLRVK